MTTSDPYITILDGNASWPDLPSGGGAYCSTDRFRVSASASTPEYHQAELIITFDTNETLCNPVASAFVSVFSINYMCPFWEENFNSDPGWTITAYPTQGSPPGPYSNWEFGTPVSGPGSAYTGLYVYGTGLSSNYDNNWTLCLTSPRIDCSGVTDVALKFAQFYQVESGYDNARVRIRNDGAGWDTILNDDGSSGDWQWREVDISSWADNEPEVELRFDLRSDSSISQAGHFIDDVWLCGMASGAGQVQPTPTLPPTNTPTPAVTNTPTPTPTGECLHHGDVNNDAEVTAGDAQTTFLIALGSYSPTHFELCAADCNGDDEVTAGDAQGVFLTALGSSACVDPLLVMKDDAVIRLLNPDIYISQLVKTGKYILADIMVTNSRVVDAFLVDIAFDSSQLELVEAVPGTLNPDWLQFDYANYSDGKVKVGGWSSGLDSDYVIPAGSNGSLVRITFIQNSNNITEKNNKLIKIMGLYDDLR